MSSGEKSDVPDKTVPLGSTSRRGNFTAFFRKMKLARGNGSADRIMPLALARADAPAAPSPNEMPQIHALQRLAPFYTIENKFASGGFCDIYLAQDNSLGRKVAIKTLNDEKNGKYSERSAFLTEAKITALLSHPNIIPVYGIYTDEARHLYLVMKRIQGKRLKQRIQDTVRRYKTMSRREILDAERGRLVEHLEIFLKICDAVSYAHHQGILHRDLKPDNIMIGEFGEPYVMDWGIAEYRQVNTLSKLTGQMAGTILYLAPEIICAKPYDSRSDIYALGTILWKIICLREAFLCGDELRQEIVAGKREPFRHQFGCPISGTLKRIVLKAVDLSPDRRYQTVALLSDAVRNYLHGKKLRFIW